MATTTKQRAAEMDIAGRDTSGEAKDMSRTAHYTKAPSVKPRRKNATAAPTRVKASKPPSKASESRGAKSKLVAPTSDSRLDEGPKLHITAESATEDQAPSSTALPEVTHSSVLVVEAPSLVAARERYCAKQYARHEYYRLFGPTTVEVRDRLVKAAEDWLGNQPPWNADYPETKLSSKEAVAHHEAGHAVFAMMFDLFRTPDVGVSLKRNGRYWHGATDHTGLGFYYAFGDAEPYGDEMHAAWEAGRFRDEVMVSLAAEHTHARFLGIPRTWVGAFDDLEEADRLLRQFRSLHMGRDLTEEDEHLLRFQGALIQIRLERLLAVDEVWYAVEHFAAALLKKNVLRGDSLWATIEAIPESVRATLDRYVEDMNYGPDKLLAVPR